LAKLTLQESSCSLRSRFVTSNATEFYRYQPGFPADEFWVAQSVQLQFVAGDPEFGFRNLSQQTRQLHEVTPESVRLIAARLRKICLYALNYPANSRSKPFLKTQN
jgi:hypothetical protein